jgi:RNA polymerase sigma-70 factor (ECF subfamily)
MRLERPVNGSRTIQPAPLSASRSSTPNLPAAQRLPALDPRPLSGGCDQLLDDAVLIDRINRGDAEAAEMLVARMRPTILKCIRRRLPRWASEEDLMQCVFAKIFAKLHQFSGSVPLEHWVARVAVNTSLSQIAHEAVRPEWRMSDLSEEHELVLKNCTTPDSGSEEQDYARETVELLLTQLKPDERLIITLLHIEQHSVQQISQQTGLSISLVKVRAFRARHKMRRLAKRLLWEEA